MASRGRHPSHSTSRAAPLSPRACCSSTDSYCIHSAVAPPPAPSSPSPDSSRDARRRLPTRLT
eukprot:scaffold71419_cov33-Phaeocystis_antarctica.AAC.1